MNKEKHIDPIPEEFSDYEEAAEFWDTHDTTDYPDEFQTVDAITEFKGRRYEVELDEEIALKLQAQAIRKGTTLSHLVNELLRAHLSTVI
ncbi:TPA: hypothetical protein ENG04_06580 [Candidatus Poribacteria bacterium]|nr:hypothetical protein [Candidatus Poribacteria bacterium]HEX29730.1 hypothetical protein [Candidatus Poribacteria bacterium]